MLRGIVVSCAVVATSVAACSSYVIVDEIEVSDGGFTQDAAIASEDATISGDASFDAAVRGAPGTLDPSFGIGGVVNVPFGFDKFGFANAFAVAVRSDDTIVAAGGYDPRTDANGEAAVIQLLPTGALDPFFGYHGAFLAQLDGGTGFANALAVEPDHTIFLAGGGGGAFAGAFLARLGDGGVLDPAFGNAGYAITQPPPETKVDEAYAVHVESDGIVFAGTRNNLPQTGVSDFAQWRTNLAGALDPTFGEAGAQIMPPLVGNVASFISIGAQSTGAIVLGGESYNGDGVGAEPDVFRFEGSALDESFGSSGSVRLHAPTSVGPPSAIQTFIFGLAVLPDDRILVGAGIAGTRGATITASLVIFRLLPNGAFDTTFGDGGASTTLLPDGGYPRGLALQRDGKIIVVGGTARGTNGAAGGEMFVARLRNDGALDTTFGDAGMFVDHDPIGSVANAVAIAPDGKIVVAGGASYFDDAHFGVWRIFP